MRISLLIFFFCFTFVTVGQNADSLRVADSTALAKQQRKQIYYSPRKATIMSAILPGLGQIYNKKYWKVPVLYVGFAGLGYSFYVNNGNYNDFRIGLKYSLDHDNKATVNGNTYYTEDLQTLKLKYKKSRDLAAIGMGILYILNVIDANVDAHLRTFDVSDDLSLHVAPWSSLSFAGTTPTNYTGMSLTLKFKK